MTEGRGGKHTDVLAQNSKQNVCHAEDTCLQECIEVQFRSVDDEKDDAEKTGQTIDIRIDGPGIIARIGNREPHRKVAQHVVGLENLRQSK